MEKSDKNRKYTRRNNFLNNELDMPNSNYRNNFQNSLILKILNNNKNLKLFTKVDKNNINSVKNIKTNIQNIFSTEESRLKAIKYIIKSRKEKRDSKSNNKPPNDLFNKEEITKTNSNENQKYSEKQDKNKIPNYIKRHLYQLSSDNIIFDELNKDGNKIRTKNKSTEKPRRKYNKRIIKNEDNHNIINNFFYNDNKFLNNNININCFSPKIIKNTNTRNKIVDKNNDKINKTEEEKNYINISFSEEGTFMPYDKNKNSNIINNEEDNNKIILINSHEISFRSFKNENEFFTNNNSNNNSFDNLDELNKNKNDKINKNVLLDICHQNDINIFNEKKYIFKFETQEGLINYIQNNKVKIDNKPLKMIFIDELYNLKKDIIKFKTEINALNKEKEFYSNEIIRLRNENELLRQKINEVYNVYEETYKINILLKEQNEKINNEYEKLIKKISLKNEYKIEPIVNFNFISKLNENINIINFKKNKNKEKAENYKSEIKKENNEEINDNKDNNA